ncbi:MAG: hypothetical protein QE487_08555 [Fluviicola sp.]|nr:hypothetical protein [Fluviicola sp.]
MRNLFFLVGILTFLSSSVLAKEKGLKSPWQYQIVSSEADPTLDQQHAVFELDFSANNFQSENPVTQIELSCNGVIERFTLDSTFKKNLLVSPGVYTFQLSAGEFHIEIITQPISIRPGFKTKIAFQFQSSQMREVYLKPVIYLYPEKEQQTTVQLQPNGKFSFTYPLYTENGWTGTAHPDGQFTIDGKNYPYLFWEGINTKPVRAIDYSSGFVVNKDDVTAFLEEKLTAMGLNDQELTDFITFWGPRMAQSERGFVQFLFNEDYDEIATIKISPQPDALFRVYMLFTPLENTVELNPEPQEIKSVNRNGFTVIEWGGSEITYKETLANHE